MNSDKVYIETFGCSLNKFDSIIMARILRLNNFKLTSTPNDANFLIINTCGVKKQTEDKIISYLKTLIRRYRGKARIIVCGCLPTINLEVFKNLNIDAIIGPSPGFKILDVIERVKDGERVVQVWSGGRSPLISCNGQYAMNVVEPIGISFGCLDNCAFCATKHARTSLLSHEPESIIKYIEDRIKNGVKEFHLTSPDTGAYGFDLKPRVRIIDLIREIDEINGSFYVRLGMMNPRWAVMWIDELIEFFRNTKHFFKFLHIPVQTGSDDLLKIMNRTHTVDDYLNVVKRIRKEVDNKFSIATDIIVGHPGETESDVESTINLLKESKPDVINISKFFPRPRTKAKLLKKIPTKIIKDRSRVVTEIALRVMFERNKMWIGWSGHILIDSYGLKGNLIGRNYAYKPIAGFKHGNLGDFIKVKVIKPHITWLEAVESPN